MPLSPLSSAASACKQDKLVSSSGKKLRTLQDLLHERGWEESSILGSGACGPVLLIRGRTGSHKSDDKFALKRSSREEVRALKTLSQCRNIVALEEHFYSPGHNEVWARLDWLDGGNLRSFLRAQRPGRVPDDVSRFFLGQILHGLVDIHRQGWMHRDVKAENIGISSPSGRASGRFECHVKLLDFDTAAKIPSAAGRLTEVIGTVENMAPEVYAGSYDERADCWSLGVLAYEVFFGYRPFNDTSIDRIEEMVRNWRNYLVIPSDASEIASSFLRWLLTSQKERLSSSQAAAHPWLQSSCEQTCAELAAASVADVLQAQSWSERSSISAPTCASSLIFLGGSSSSTAPCSPQPRIPSKQSSPLKKSPSSSRYQDETSRFSYSPSALAESKALDDLSRIRRSLADTSTLQSTWSPSSPSKLAGSDAVESLSRIRRSLAEWNSPSIGRTIFKDSPSSRAPVVDNMDHRRFASARESTRLTESASEVAHRFRMESAREPSSSSASNARETLDDDHEEYLQRVRARTQEMMKAASAMATCHSARERAFTDESTPSRSTPSRLTGRRFSAPAPLVISEAEVFSTSISDCQSPLSHLEDTKLRMNRLLSRLSSASEEAIADQQRMSGEAPGGSSGSSYRQCSSPLQPEPEPIVQESSYSDDRYRSSFSAEPAVSERPTSPSSWLAQQRHRTEKLLGRLRIASQGADDDLGSATPEQINSSCHSAIAVSSRVESRSSRPVAV